MLGLGNKIDFVLNSDESPLRFYLRLERRFAIGRCSWISSNYQSFIFVQLILCVGYCRLIVSNRGSDGVDSDIGYLLMILIDVFKYSGVNFSHYIPAGM